MLFRSGFIVNLHNRMKADKIIQMLFIAGGFWIFCLLSPGESRAELYYFRDAQGSLHFSNTPDDARYKRISELKGEKIKNVGGTPTNQFSDFKEIIEKIAKKYRIDPYLLRAMIKVESDYDPYAVSTSGAQGLMQLMPGTSLRMDVGNPFNPEENIEGGAKYVKQLLTLFNGQLIPTVAAYHAGENTVIRYNNQIPPIDATQKYVRKVLTEYYRYHGINITAIRPNKIYRVETVDGNFVFTNRPAALQVKYKEVAYR